MTSTTTPLWILGTPDPEMEMIERLLQGVGQRVAYATCGGRRAHPGNAYRADPVDVPAGTTPVWVECAPSAGRPEGSMVIDHHQHGDPGFGRAPEEFLPASSIGQVIAALARLGSLPRQWPAYSWPHAPAPIIGTISHYLADGGGGYPTPGGWVVTRGMTPSETPAWYGQIIPIDLVLTAAADHCLGAAYRDECPGVAPDTLMRWRAESRATFQRRPVAAVLADVEATTAALRAAPRVVLRHQTEYDRFGQPCDWSGYPAVDYDDQVDARDMRREPPWPELPEAAARVGESYISGPLAGPDGRRKVTCSGSPEHIRAFMDSWSPAQGLVDLYGDPARGFAGGYLPA
jgi:hypothetical protein